MESLRWNTPSSTESSPTGTTWRRSGITLSTTSCASPRKSTRSCWPRLPWTRKPTERRWRKSCSKRSTRPPCTLPSRPCFRCTLPVVPPVSCSTPATASPTPFRSTKVTRSPTPSYVSTSPEEISPTTWWKSSPNAGTLSPPPPNEKSSATSRRSFATSPWTSTRKWLPPLPRPPWRRATSCPTVRWSPSETRGSVAPRRCSSRPSWEWNPPASTKPPTTRSWSATSTSVRTSTPTPYCPAVAPCSPVSPTECRRRSPPWLRLPWRSRSSRPPNASTPCGSEDRFSPRCPPSSRCGSANRSTTNPAPQSCTANASKFRFARHSGDGGGDDGVTFAVTNGVRSRTNFDARHELADRPPRRYMRTYAILRLRWRRRLRCRRRPWGGVFKGTRHRTHRRRGHAPPASLRRLLFITIRVLIYTNWNRVI